MHARALALALLALAAGGAGAWAEAPASPARAAVNAPATKKGKTAPPRSSAPIVVAPPAPIPPPLVRRLSLRVLSGGALVELSFDAKGAALYSSRIGRRPLSLDAEARERLGELGRATLRDKAPRSGCFGADSTVSVVIDGVARSSSVCEGVVRAENAPWIAVRDEVRRFAREAAGMTGAAPSGSDARSPAPPGGAGAPTGP